jgi:hypothetical protein
MIIAVDPGQTCGWAMADFGDGHFTPEGIVAGQAVADDWEDWCAANVSARCTVVVEKFMITARTAELSPQPRAIEVTGVMKFIARRTGATFIGSQTPSAAKKFASDTQLKKVGLWCPGQDHARDAIRHLLLAIATQSDGQARQEMLQSLA